MISSIQGPAFGCSRYGSATDLEPLTAKVLHTHWAVSLVFLCSGMCMQ